MTRQMAAKFKYLRGFSFGSCHVRTKSIIGFTAQKWPNNDPLEQRETAVFIFYPDKPDDRKWAYGAIGEATGIHGCAAFVPDERWIFVTDDGQVYAVGQGQHGYEQPISDMPILYFSNVKSVRNGRAIAVGPKRKVFVRSTSNRWARLDSGLFPQGDKTDLEHAGFRDIDGFSEQDMYACGGHADLWHYNGKRWTQIDLPTNAVLEKVCCSEDGVVYITTNTRDILRGRGAVWDIIAAGKPKERLESIVSYGGNVIVSTIPELYFVDANGFRLANLGVPKIKSKAHLASGDGILVVAGRDEAVMYDGQNWKRIV